ncbi:probable Sua5/YciO/YrdC family protein [Thiobacillus denitrificans ATCC 25259]|uniref:Threonylcarbamoyl-AMP synthase n=1 Tax=Thiobacillus denitrificans (strain ATCC 25259 / T1) TaxID=292415 RepID=TSAC_THIDA|nr:Sua5/YciO/YrdC/YwlC family protein [Thiobacillus denitrificans]Q3SG43.1 RecName: Full=Threonylcarbamoyl-AMP synthase; Short=TC-AMP synthase; AltName: Full=L-threonylcarbamoyladenylate synthase; AltName: Full=t(6)A37 threonylcarbamoyladenosine biosynthesis protein TsaC; AltName: Full=tRNA threonylcarbamoyladenosine biosynthesis protein TsaC [Thiobacillus denitrificans ATCC 25259]AAZ98413.1 probable Sua5/YciO/YrdC family protein [Thiobacillus denitrificans ATCC 25259]
MSTAESREGAQPGLHAYLRRGGVIAYPTESCYGLGCDPRNAAALRRLIRLKGRDAGKGMLLIADRYRRLQPFVGALSPTGRARMRRSWPGPVTWVVPASRRCPPELTGGRTTVAVRVTAHRPAAALCRSLGTALVSTSANKSGHTPAKTAAQCRRMFGARVRVVDGRIGTRRRPSTLIDLATGKILRA